MSRAWWVQTKIQFPQPMQRSWLMLTFPPAPLLQYFTGQAVIQAWQFTHFSSSILITGVNVFVFINSTHLSFRTASDKNRKFQSILQDLKQTFVHGNQPRFLAKSIII
jgi:hypothetical protein